MFAAAIEFIHTATLVHDEASVRITVEGEPEVGTMVEVPALLYQLDELLEQLQLTPWRDMPVAALVGDRVVAGTIDRLVIGPDRLRIVDFKTTRRPPEALAEVPVAVLRVGRFYRKDLAPAIAALAAWGVSDGADPPTGAAAATTIGVAMLVPLSST